MRNVTQVLLLLAICAGLSITIQTESLAHEPPPGTWSCDGGDPHVDPEDLGDCWNHLPYAEAEWHFSGFQQDQTLKTIVRKGRNEWVDGHALHLPINSASPNHVNWDTVCTVACAALTRGANEHITAFQIHFDSDWAWNLDYTASHGTFTNLDMRSVAAHEWGHVVGLGHSTRGYGHDCASGSGTMGTMAQGTAGCINNGHTEQRSISVKDEEGRCEIYSHAHGYSC